MTTRMIRVMLSVFAMALGTTAQAGLLPVTVTVLPDGNNYRWTYAIVLPTDSQLRTGDYFTIYDFGGLVAGSNSQPNDWAYTQTNKGPIPAGVAPDDSDALPNLTWTYNGPTIVSGSTGLGNFWAVSLYQDSVNSFFTARTHRTTDGIIDTNITDTTVPVPTGPGDPNTVPEPMTLVMAGLGLPLVGLARAIRRKNASAK